MLFEGFFTQPGLSPTLHFRASLAIIQYPVVIKTKVEVSKDLDFSVLLCS